MSDDIVERLEPLTRQGEDYIWRPVAAAIVEIRHLRSEIERLRAGRAAVVETKGFCWSCGATPRYQHKDGCRASGLRALKGGAA